LRQESGLPRIVVEKTEFPVSNPAKDEFAMASLKELIAQKEALDREIENKKKEARADAIAKVRALMAEYGLTSADLNAKSTAKAGARSGAKVAVKYRDAATGETWSGRGLRPNWLKAALASGRKIDEFAV
jgi:DNA-binding protein H-NS